MHPPFFDVTHLPGRPCADAHHARAPIRRGRPARLDFDPGHPALVRLWRPPPAPRRRGRLRLALGRAFLWLGQRLLHGADRPGPAGG